MYAPHLIAEIHLVIESQPVFSKHFSGEQIPLSMHDIACMFILARKIETNKAKINEIEADLFANPLHDNDNYYIAVSNIMTFVRALIHKEHPPRTIVQTQRRGINSPVQSTIQPCPYIYYEKRSLDSNFYFTSITTVIPSFFFHLIVAATGAALCTLFVLHSPEDITQKEFWIGMVIIALCVVIKNNKPLFKEWRAKEYTRSYHTYKQFTTRYNCYRNTQLL